MNESFDLATLLRKVLEENMGYALDLARISNMQDRQFAQFEKSLKSATRKSLQTYVQLLNDCKGNFVVDMSILEKKDSKKETE